MQSRQDLFHAFGLLLAIAAAALILATGLGAAHGKHGHASAEFASMLGRLEALAEVRRALRGSGRWIEQIARGGPGAAQGAGDTSIREVLAAVARVRALARHPGTLPAERAASGALEATVRGLASHLGAAREHLRAGRVEAVRAALAGKAGPMLERGLEQVATLESLSRSNQRGSVARAAGREESAHRLMFWGLALVTVAGLLAVAYVVRRASESERRHIEHSENLEALVRERTRELRREMSVRIEAEAAARHGQYRLGATLASIGDGVIATDDEGRIEFMNPVAEALTGWTVADARGRAAGEVLCVVDAATGQSVDVTVEARTPERDRCLVRADGSEIDVEETVAPIRDEAGRSFGTVIVTRDVSEMRRLSRRLAYQASHDPLTGLINRREFERRTAEVLDEAHASGSRHTLCYIDLDQFKVVNDTSGHAVGDHLLQSLSRMLAVHLRQTDVLGRLGGDEFGLLLPRCPAEKGLALAEKLRQTVAEHRLDVDGYRCSIGASIGVVDLCDEFETLADALSAADSACYLAKEKGRNCVHLYRAADAEVMQRRGEMRWVSRLKAALEENRFELYCQPIVPLVRAPGDRTLYEVLLRLRDDDTLVMPGAFLPAAERYGLLPHIDRFVFDKVIDWLAANGSALGSGKLTVNVSGATLSEPDFLEHVTARLATTPAGFDHLVFELTESSALRDVNVAIDFMSALGAHGCEFALDDFGRGFSSLSSLKRLPVDYLKIDGEFVRDMLDDPKDEAVVLAVHEIGRAMNKRVIAEFVESDAIADRLMAIGVEFGQGYGIARPAPIAKLCDAASTEAPVGILARLAV